MCAGSHSLSFLGQHRWHVHPNKNRCFCFRIHVRPAKHNRPTVSGVFLLQPERWGNKPRLCKGHRTACLSPAQTLMQPSQAQLLGGHLALSHRGNRVQNPDLRAPCEAPSQGPASSGSSRARRPRLPSGPPPGGQEDACRRPPPLWQNQLPRVTRGRCDAGAAGFKSRAAQPLG